MLLFYSCRGFLAQGDVDLSALLEAAHGDALDGYLLAVDEQGEGVAFARGEGERAVLHRARGVDVRGEGDEQEGADGGDAGVLLLEAEEGGVAARVGGGVGAADALRGGVGAGHEVAGGDGEVSLEEGACEPRVGGGGERPCAARDG